METKPQFDLLIIGAGPAGLTAAIYACRKRIKTLVVSPDIGGQAQFPTDIENFPGEPGISGASLTKHFEDHLRRFSDYITIQKQKVVSLRVSVAGKGFDAELDDESKVTARAVMIASGRKPRSLGVPGEADFWGHGVFHSGAGSNNASRYTDKNVALVGGGNSALDAGITLARFARTVTVINNLPELHGDEILKDKLLSSSKVKVINGATLARIWGEEYVRAVNIKHLDTGSIEEAEVSAVFIEVGWEPATGFEKLTKKDSIGRIMVDAKMATSVTGIWATGDVNDAEGEQIIIAAGEGAKGAMSVSDWLMKQ